jgi:hypothetical protein
MDGFDFDFDLDFDLDGDGGFGWILPAFIVGRLFSDAFDRRPPGRGTGAPAHPPTPAPPAPQPRLASTSATPQVNCAHCQRGFDAAFVFCPHCGHSAQRRECRYCGREIPPGMRACLGCGAPATASRA